MADKILPTLLGVICQSGSCATDIRQIHINRTQPSWKQPPRPSPERLSGLSFQFR